MAILAMFLAALAAGAYFRGRQDPGARSALLVADTVKVAFMVWVIWFALLFTGRVRLDWFARWVGQPRLSQDWIRIVFFAPPLAAALVYLLVRTVTGRSRDDAAKRS